MELATNGMTPTMKYCWSRRRLFSGLSLSYCWSSHTRIIHIISSILDLIIKLEVFGDGLPFDVLTAGPPLDTNVGRPSWSCSLFLFHHDVDVVCVLCAVAGGRRHAGGAAFISLWQRLVGCGNLNETAGICIDFREFWEFKNRAVRIPTENLLPPKLLVRRREPSPLFSFQNFVGCSSQREATSNRRDTEDTNTNSNNSSPIDERRSGVHH
jgi:hypothetical protein